MNSNLKKCIFNKLKIVLRPEALCVLSLKGQAGKRGNRLGQQEVEVMGVGPK